MKQSSLRLMGQWCDRTDSLNDTSEARSSNFAAIYCDAYWKSNAVLKFSHFAQFITDFAFLRQIFFFFRFFYIWFFFVCAFALTMWVWKPRDHSLIVVNFLNAHRASKRWWIPLGCVCVCFYDEAVKYVIFILKINIKLLTSLPLFVIPASLNIRIVRTRIVQAACKTAHKIFDN